jgi:hypothetical protein
MPKYVVVTTFNAKGYDQYAQKFLKTFINHWPKEIIINIYTEECVIYEVAPNFKVYDLHKVSLDIVKFKEKWKNDPKANGDVRNDPIRSRRKDAGKGFKWDAIRFCHKVYSIFHCAATTDAEILIWMDADMICHSPISLDTINSLIPKHKDLCYLGRDGKYPECGLYSLNLSHNLVKLFLKEFKRMYDEAENGIFQLDEWHDSFVFEEVRKKFPNLELLNWSKELTDIKPNKFNSQGEGHPLINTQWGAYLDHLKGSRKISGKSNLLDLKVQRKELYWTNNV